jgi:cobalt/nickel transport system permease protein
MAYIEALIGHGPLSRCDARVKFILLILWSALLALVSSLPAALTGLVASLALAALCGCSKKALFLKRLFLINFFLIFVWLVLPFSFSVPGQSLGSFGPFTLTKEGLTLSATLSLKALAITASAMAFTASTNLYDFMAAARALGCPMKLTAMLALSSRYVVLIIEEFQRLIWAMKIRGFTAKCNLRTFKTYANLAGILLVRGLDRGDKVHAAMLCRGYDGRFFIIRPFRLSFIDAAISLIVATFSLVVAYQNVR